MGIACAQQDLTRVYPLADDPERCVEDFLEQAAEHALGSRRAARSPGGLGAALPRAQRQLTRGTRAGDRYRPAPMRAPLLIVLIAGRGRRCSWSISALLARAFSVGGAEDSAITDLVKAEARGDAAGVIALDHAAAAASPACRARAAASRRALRRPGAIQIIEINAVDRLLARLHARHGAGGLAGGRLAAARAVRARPPRRQRAQRLHDRAAEGQRRGSRATPTARATSSALRASARTGRAGRLARRAALAAGAGARPAGRLAQAHPRRARRRAAGCRRGAASAAAAAAWARGPSRRRPRRPSGDRARRSVPQRGEQEHCHARQTREVDSGDPSTAERRLTWTKVSARLAARARHFCARGDADGRRCPGCPLPSNAADGTRPIHILKVAPREPGGSRSARRLRREGNVPGVVYGGGEDPVSFQVQARDLRLALAARRRGARPRDRGRRRHARRRQGARPPPGQRRHGAHRSAARPPGREDPVDRRARADRGRGLARASRRAACSSTSPAS